PPPSPTNPPGRAAPQRPLAPRRPLELGRTHPAAIVLDLEGHPAALTANADRPPPHLALVCRPALVGAFDPVVHAVAQDVENGLGEVVEDGSIQLDLRAADGELDAAVAPPR